MTTMTMMMTMMMTTTTMMTMMMVEVNEGKSERVIHTELIQACASTSPKVPPKVALHKSESFIERVTRSRHLIKAILLFEKQNKTKQNKNKTRQDKTETRQNKTRQKQKQDKTETRQNKTRQTQGTIVTELHILGLITRPS